PRCGARRRRRERLSETSTPGISFTGVIRILGVNPYVQVSAARARRIKPGWRKPLPVLVRINGHPKPKPWRINLMPQGTGAFYLYLHGEVRRASGTKVGDRVAVEISFDAAYRGGPTHLIPPWFRAPLTRNKRAATAWKALTPSRQKEILRYLMALKSDEARNRNVARAIHVLSGAKSRFMARSWSAGK
ncbi:MAG: YdeI/OmpD-associated family protein, partial [Gemmatimonadales bacterium]